MRGHMPFSDEDAYHQEEAGPDADDLAELDSIIHRSVVMEDDYEGGRWHPGDY